MQHADHGQSRAAQKQKLRKASRWQWRCFSLGAGAQSHGGTDKRNSAGQDAFLLTKWPRIMRKIVSAGGTSKLRQNKIMFTG